MNNKVFYINLATQNLKEKLINDIKQSNLPIINIYLLWQKLGKEIEMSYYEALNQELAESQQQETMIKTQSFQQNNCKNQQ